MYLKSPEVGFMCVGVKCPNSGARNLSIISHLFFLYVGYSLVQTLLLRGQDGYERLKVHIATTLANAKRLVFFQSSSSKILVLNYVSLAWSSYTSLENHCFQGKNKVKRNQDAIIKIRGNKFWAGKTWVPCRSNNHLLSLKDFHLPSHILKDKGLGRVSTPESSYKVWSQSGKSEAIYMGKDWSQGEIFVLIGILVPLSYAGP